jgi:hypothetical protein
MANKRILKKQIKYVCGDLAGECIMAIHFVEGIDVEQMQNVIFDIATLQTTSLKRVTFSFDKTASELAKVKKELGELKNNNLTGEEKVNAAIAAADARANEYSVKLNRLEVEKLFMADGLTEADYADLIDDIVSEDTDKTIKLAKNLLAVVKSQKSAAEKSIRAELLKKTPKPPAGDNDGEVMTMEKFRKLSPKERFDFSVNNPEEYKKLYGGKT